MDEKLEETIKKQLEEFASEKLVRKMYFEFHHDWDSLMFWQGMNWRNFTLIKIQGEISTTKIIELDLAFLGFHFNIDWYRKKEKPMQ